MLQGTAVEGSGRLRWWRRLGQAAEVLSSVGEMLDRVGVDAGGVVAEELPHNRSLSPGVWRVRTGAGQLGVLKYTNSERSRGTTPWETHWTARDQDPERWTYWCRERSRVLLFNAQWARRAVELADQLGL